MLIGVGVALAVAGVLVAGALVSVRAPGQSFGDLVKVFPDAIRLVRSLYRDPTVPKPRSTDLLLW